MGRFSLYYLIVFLTFLYVIFKNRNSPLKILIILCFYSGLASFPGKAIENPYKIILVILSVYLLLKNNGLTGLKSRESYFLFVFILFSVSFLFSSIVNDDYFNLIFSQYGKYVTPICIFLIFSRILIKNPGFFISLKELFFTLLTIQVILSIIKIPTLGIQESFVGSLSFIGGGPAAMVPVLGFILIWLHKKGDIKGKDWVYILLLIFIAFASLKRAIWFMMPIFIILFMYYVPRKLKSSHLLYAIPLIPLIFYAGVRLNPTLNREGKLGGSFDLNYVLNYTQVYSFGKTSETSGIKAGSGRGGATILLFEKLFNSQPLSFEDYWGVGLREVYTTDYEEFNDKKYGVNGKGAVTGVFQTYIVSGYVGVIMTVLLIIAVCMIIKEKRIRTAIAILLFWDYLFYSGLILRSQALFIMLFFIILYSNFQFDQKLYRRYQILKPEDTSRNLKPVPV